MSIQQIIKEAIEKSPLGVKEAVHEELSKRIALALESKLKISDSQTVNEAEYEIGNDIHQSNHAGMAQMHRELANRHRNMGGKFNMKAAQEHMDAATANDAAANHMYSFERSSDVHTATHEPSIKAARAVLDKAAAQSKAAFSASHLADAEDKD